MKPWLIALVLFVPLLAGCGSTTTQPNTVFIATYRGNPYPNTYGELVIPPASSPDVIQHWQTTDAVLASAMYHRLPHLPHVSPSGPLLCDGRWELFSFQHDHTILIQANTTGCVSAGMYIGRMGARLPDAQWNQWVIQITGQGVQF